MLVKVEEVAKKTKRRYNVPYVYQIPEHIRSKLWRGIYSFLNMQGWRPLCRSTPTISMTHACTHTSICDNGNVQHQKDLSLIKEVI